MFLFQKFFGTILLLAFAALSPTTSMAQNPAPEKKVLTNTGFTIVKLGEDGALWKAGIRPGDVLLSFLKSTSPETKDSPHPKYFTEPFDLKRAEIVQAPRGGLTLLGRRGSRRMEWAPPPGKWLIQEVIPPLEFPVRQFVSTALGSNEKKKKREAWEAAIALTENNSLARVWVLAEALNAFFSDPTSTDFSDRLHSISTVSSPGEVSLWANISWANHLNREKKFIEAAEIFQSLVKNNNLDPLMAAYLNNQRGNAGYNGRSVEIAVAGWMDSVIINEQQGVKTLNLAWTYNNLGLFSQYSSDLEAAKNYHSKALALRRKLNPGSLQEGDSLLSLGVLAHDQGDLAAAENLNQQALAIQEKIAPGSQAVAKSLNNLGVLADERGELGRAEEFHQLAWHLFSTLAPDSPSEAKSLVNLGVLASERGNLEAAEKYYRQALAIEEKIEPEGLRASAVLNNLGLLAQHRRNFKVAEGFLVRALAIRQKDGREAMDVAETLNNLGALARAHMDLNKAEEFQLRSLAIKQKLAPDSWQAAATMSNLGNIALDRGELDQAEKHFQKSLGILEPIASGGLAFASNLYDLGALEERRNNFKKAETYFRRFLEIQEFLAPSSTRTALGNHHLARVLGKTSRKDESLDHFEKAAEALEAQIEMLGGSEQTAGIFAASNQNLYRDYVDVLAETGRNPSAFLVLERSRARQLLIMLAERDLVFGEDVPEDLLREQHHLTAEYRRTMEQLAQANLQDQKAISRLRLDIEQTQQKQTELKEKIRQVSPSYGSLQYPRPLNLVQVQNNLDPGTVVVTWSVGQARTVLFVLTKEQFQVHLLEFDRKSLGRNIRRFRTEILEGSSSGLSQTLSRQLFGPAGEVLRHAQRLLIIPDGPLHVLPFAALADPVDIDTGAFLVSRLPIHLAVSATVYSELKQTRSRPDLASIYAFGDPVYPENFADLVPGLKGVTLPRLAGSLDEVRAIEKTFGDSASILVGPEASEKRAGETGDINLVHFACHGILDEYFPLNSGLVLSLLPEGSDHQGAQSQDGFLQAWEIFEHLRLKADLVTLSACGSGLGQEMGGEGLIGLTRAFQYAGARSVLASLWSVNDLSTAVLMERFYQELKSGLSKDEALRQAQLHLASGPINVQTGVDKKGQPVFERRDYTHPFYWAAFVLHGDWE